MTSPLGGKLGDLLLSAWIGETPDGTEAVYLLLTTDDHRAPVTMPLVAGALGLNPTPNTVTPTVDPTHCHATISPDHWIHINPGGTHLTAPLPAEGTDMLRAQRRAVLVIGHQPMPADTDGPGYVERHPTATSLGVIQVRTTD